MSTLVQKRMDALSPEKRRLLEILQRERQGGGPRPTAAGPRELVPASAPFFMLSEADRARLPEGVEDAYPVSRLQLGMIYHMQLTLDDPVPAYHNVNGFHMVGPFDAAAFSEAVRQVVHRHALLRTSFDLATYSEPLQLVHASAAMTVSVVDLRGLTPAAKARAIAAFDRAENRRVFDLSKPPLMRLHVHRFENDEFHVTLTEMHAISEGWSTAMTLSEIYSRFRQLMAGERPPEEPPPSFLYRDFIFLERQALGSQECRDFWLRQLADCTVPRLPGRRSAPSAREDNRKPMSPVEPEVLAGLHRLAALAGVPIKSVLLAAHLKVLSMITGQADLLTGLQTHGRPEHPDAVKTIGVFINYVPLRCGLASSTWLDLVRQAFELEAELIPYRRYPLAEMQREWSEGPLLETAFAYLNFHSVERLLRASGPDISGRFATDRSVTHFALHVTFHVREGTDELLLLLEYDDAHLAAEQVRAIRSYFEAVLLDMATRPESRHDRRSFLPPAEESQMLSPRPSVFADAISSLPGLFAAQVAKAPEVIALVYGEERLTYRELDDRSNRVCSTLRAQGVGPEVLVGVYVERSLDLVVGLLGVLKAGGAYVPLDPDYPEERIAYLVEDSRLAAVLTQSHLAERLSGLAKRHLPLVLIDGSLPLGPAGPPGCDVQPHNTAYVIYTSGSTGRPKGVVVTHANVARLLSSSQELFGFSASGVWPLFHSFAFDFSVWEMWGALAYGGRLVVVPYFITRTPAAFHELLARERVTVLNQTPSAFRQLDWSEESGAVRDELALDWIIFGGEALDPLSLAPWYARHGDRRPRLINMYGITETTVHVTFRALERSDARPEAASPIGEPLPDLQVRLLDRWGQPVPPGAPGEIYVSGAGLARGYLHRPALTAERFVPDPFGEPGGRAYRSGDLARKWQDGAIEYLGRIDNQVKLRGFRVELGEIESLLCELPEVKEAVVVTREDQPGDVRLAAYVVAWPGEAPSVSILRGRLRERLPEHMMPATWTLLEQLPRTAHGKLDRRALPAPSSVQIEADTPYVAPQGEIETTVVDVLKEILGLERIGVNDNFFDAGANSLLLLRAHGLLELRFGAGSLELMHLFRHSTARRLAEHLAGAAAAAAPAHETARGANRRQAATAQGQRRRQARSAPAASEDLDE